MKKLLSRLVWVPVGLALVVFLVANRQLVPVSLDPFSTENPAIATPALPLWVWLMLMLLVGYFLGAMTLWLSGRGRRKQANLERKELKALRKEMEIVEATRAPGSSDSLPVLEAS